MKTTRINYNYHSSDLRRPEHLASPSRFPFLVAVANRQFVVSMSPQGKHQSSDS